MATGGLRRPRPAPELCDFADRQVHWHCLGADGTGKAFSILLGRLQQELRETYGAENALKVMLAIMETTE